MGVSPGFTEVAGQDAVFVLLERAGFALSDTPEGEALKRAVRDLGFLDVLNLINRAAPRAVGVSSALYACWLEGPGRDSPLAHAAWFNLGVALAGEGKTDEAAVAYGEALLRKPDQHYAAVNLGLLREGQGRDEDALEIWRRSIQSDEARTMLLNNRGRMLERLGRFDEAERELFRSLLTDPKQKDAFSHWLHLRLKMCAWPVFGQGVPGLSVQELIAGAGGLSLLALFDDNSVVNNWVADWIARKAPVSSPPLAPADGYVHERVRIGYLSSDYNNHPVSMLIAELIERHDRSRFEIFGYCIGRDDGSPLRARVTSAFDRFTRLVELNDEDAAKRISADEIDILIDLNGLTEGARLGILRRRPAPVQITYLGFVGSLPVPELDYAIADIDVVPPELEGDFHPKPLRLPRCYQVNDTKAPIGAPETRASLGLPEDRFVYCCFSNTFKISAEIFDSWMRVLAAVPNSVLWVLSRTPWSRENMRARAVLRGVDPTRLIYAEATSPARYLSRLRLADLFLDTFPYNSGTTASDALRMGLPIVTLRGKTFSSRMAASLLRAVGTEEGITTSYDEYVDRAVRLGSDPAAHTAFRDALAGGATWRRTLGDIEGFVPEYEASLLSVLRTPPGR